MVEHLLGKGYSLAHVGAFAMLLCQAEQQTPRGHFKTRAMLTAALDCLTPQHGQRARVSKYLPFLIHDGAVIEEAGGSWYVPGWDEWQEGDVTVRERVHRIRGRNGGDRYTGNGADRNSSVTREHRWAVGGERLAVSGEHMAEPSRAPIPPPPPENRGAKSKTNPRARRSNPRALAEAEQEAARPRSTDEYLDRHPEAGEFRPDSFGGDPATTAEVAARVVQRARGKR